MQQYVIGFTLGGRPQYIADFNAQGYIGTETGDLQKAEVFSLDAAAKAIQARAAVLGQAFHTVLSIKAVRRRVEMRSTVVLV